MFTFQSCKKSRSDMGKVLFSKTRNKVFKDVTPDGFAPVLKEMLASEKSKLNNAAVITAYYEQHDYDPELLMDHIADHDLDSVAACFERANEHGLSPKLFQTDELKQLLAKFNDKKGIKTLDEAYHNMAQLEILLANSLINYSNDLQFGILNPRRIYARYFTETQRPDSTSMNRVFYTANLSHYLDSIQPKNPQYLALQKALASGYTAPNMSKEETQRAIIVNLERLRWKNRPAQGRYVRVNIPAFQLDVMENGKSTLNMKVCVGEGRNKDYTNNLVEYDDSDKTDRPFSRETPQLNSMIYEAQVNPVWNIPASIASKEIIVEAKKDPYFLSNNNINVYKDGKLVEDSETIHWDEAGAGTDYSFKQQPGDDNSLGKIKFLFQNKSSVYLHDTPAKQAFNRPMRAISHGCVRLEKPLDLAQALFGDGPKYQMISKYMQEDREQPTDIALPKKVPVYITYVTCWNDENGQLQFSPDVYGLDIVLFAHLQKLMAV
jgi:murein L,D-transpeptidase YcbB/YkuD